MMGLLVVLCTTALVISPSTAQLSKPFVHDGQITNTNNKFVQRQAVDDKRDRKPPDEEPLHASACPADVTIKWMSEVSSSIYATPVIADLYGDAIKDIITPSFVHYLEVLEGTDGAPAPGWPAFHKSTLHSSPVLFDWDGDGVQDIVIATYNGEIMAFRDTGEMLPGSFELGRLAVHKDWYVGLAPDHVDHSHPDVGDGGGGVGGVDGGVGGGGGQRRQLLQEGQQQGGDGSFTVQPKTTLSEEAEASFHQLFEEAASGSSDASLDTSQQQYNQDNLHGGMQGGMEGSNTADTGGDATSDGGDSGAFAFKQPDDFYDLGMFGELGDLATPHHLREDPGEGAAADAEVDAHHHGRVDPLFTSEYYDEGGVQDAVHYEHYDRNDLWQDEEFEGARHSAQPGFVDVDAHVMSNPVFADLDGDGVEELIVAASFFYDKDYYDAPAHAHEVAGIQIDKYVAGAVVVYDTQGSRSLRWRTHLDLSTDQTVFRAYIYSSPTIADLDGDGMMEIIVGTSMGFLYVLDHKGRSLPGWPIQLGEIQAQPVVLDINNDGWLEVVIVDVRGNVAAFTRLGTEVWERHLASMVTQAPTAGDIDGDGALELVMGTGSGRIVALRAGTGEFVRHFPVGARGKIMAPVTVVKLQDESVGQHVVVPSFDGLLYIVDGVTGCVDTLDIGETSYGMVLVDDLDDNGYLDLVMVTMNGNVIAMDTRARYQPLKTWTSQVHGINNFVARYGHVGVYATHATRTRREIRGTSFTVQFTIVDTRPPVGQGGRRQVKVDTVRASGNAVIAGRGPYKVSVMLRGVSVADMKAGDQPVVGLTDTYDAPGTYSLTIPCPRARVSGSVYVEMVDETGVVYHDEYAVSFHVGFHRLLKWLLAVPFTAMALSLLTMKNLAGRETQLPSYLG